MGTVLGATEVDLSTSSSPMIYSTSISYSYRILSGCRNSKKGHRFKPSEGERERELGVERSLGDMGMLLACSLRAESLPARAVGDKREKEISIDESMMID